MCWILNMEMAKGFLLDLLVSNSWFTHPCSNVIPKMSKHVKMLANTNNDFFMFWPLNVPGCPRTSHCHPTQAHLGLGPRASCMSDNGPISCPGHPRLAYLIGKENKETLSGISSEELNQGKAALKLLLPEKATLNICP